MDILRASVGKQGAKGEGMSREDLVEAYVEGGISRRTFIRRLVAGGVSFGAAVSYAHLLAPKADAAIGRAGDGQDHYEPEIEVAIRSERILKVVNQRKLEVTVSTDDSSTFDLVAKLRKKGKLQTIGRKQVTFAGATTNAMVRIPVSKAGCEILGSRDTSTVRVECAATHQQTLPAAAFTSRAVTTKLLLR
jgi:hypothetical protein